MPRFSTDRLTRASSRRGSEAGYAMAALLVGLSIMAVALSVAMPTWRTFAQREREAELVFRGEQYARAIALYQRRYANAFPPNFDLLVDQRFLRRKYKDPITNDDFQILLVGQEGPNQPPGGGPERAGGPGAGAAPAGQRGGDGFAQQPAGLSATPLGGTAGILGVSSKSSATSMREYNGRRRYNEWTFVATQATTRAGGPNGGQNPTSGAGGDGRGGGRGLGPDAGSGPGRGGPPQPGAGGRGSGRPFGGGPTSPFGGARP